MTPTQDRIASTVGSQLADIAEEAFPNARIIPGGTDGGMRVGYHATHTTKGRIRLVVYAIAPDGEQIAAVHFDDMGPRGGGPMLTIRGPAAPDAWTAERMERFFRRGVRLAKRGHRAGFLPASG